MILHTFQNFFVYENLIELGYYHPYHLESHTDHLNGSEFSWDFENAYLWLKKQMYQKNIRYSYCNSHMIWAWRKENEKLAKKPDLRRKKLYNTSNKYVLLEIDISEDRVLLSDFEFWHFVLNYWYLNSYRNTEKFLKQFNYFEEKPLKNFEGNSLIEKSWEIIFDLEFIRKKFRFSKKNQLIQATFFELFFNDIVSATIIENGKIKDVIKYK